MAITRIATLPSNAPPSSNVTKTMRAAAASPPSKSPLASSTSAANAVTATSSFSKLEKDNKSPSPSVVTHGFSGNSWSKTSSTSPSCGPGSSKTSSKDSSFNLKSITSAVNDSAMMATSSTTKSLNHHILPTSSSIPTNNTTTSAPAAPAASKDNSSLELSASFSTSPSSALDALAFFASNVHTITPSTSTSTSNKSSKDYDAEIMPPPPPRIKGRVRSASNPEGMEKWDSYSYFRHNSGSFLSSSGTSFAFTNYSSYSSLNNSRRHFVLPSSILEEELAEVNETCKIYEEQRLMEEEQQKQHLQQSFVPSIRRGMTIFSVNELSNDDEEDEDEEMNNSISPTTVMKTTTTAKTTTNTQEKNNKTKSNNTSSKSKRGRKKKSSSSTSSSDEDTTTQKQSEEDKGDDASNLEPEELLRRARNKLFEDLSCAENCGLDKGLVPFPHLLGKYKEIYNKNGRIGIYTPAERAAIIAKFNSKRRRRVWNKKIRYNCRKNLADRRMRVKGRFVKRSVEQANDDGIVQQKQEQQQLQDSSSGTKSASSSGTNSPTLSSVQEDDDVEMPDVNDPEAGFQPTAKQPFRRTRRHTIT